MIDTILFLVWTTLFPLTPAVFMAGLAVGAFLFRA